MDFDTQKSADLAVNGMLLNDKKVYVGRFIPRKERNQDQGDQSALYNYTQIYSARISGKILTMTSCMVSTFDKFGKIVSAVVMVDKKERSFVRFLIRRGFQMFISVLFQAHPYLHLIFTEFLSL